MSLVRKTFQKEAASASIAAVGMGSATTAAIASACCAGPALGPLVVSVFGAGGAVALEGFRPYAIPLLILSGLAIVASFWMSARGAKRCSTTGPSKVARAVSLVVLGISSAAWIAAVAAVLWSRIAS
ncbi:MAG: hypothetical protein WBD74_08235 [Candidatus Aquilonibacter sp.]